MIGDDQMLMLIMICGGVLPLVHLILISRVSCIDRLDTQLQKTPDKWSLLFHAPVCKTLPAQLNTSHTVGIRRSGEMHARTTGRCASAYNLSAN